MAGKIKKAFAKVERELKSAERRLDNYPVAAASGGKGYDNLKDRLSKEIINDLQKINDKNIDKIEQKVRSEIERPLIKIRKEIKGLREELSDYALKDEVDDRFEELESSISRGIAALASPMKKLKVKVDSLDNLNKERLYTAPEEEDEDTPDISISAKRLQKEKDNRRLPSEKKGSADKEESSDAQDEESSSEEKGDKSRRKGIFSRIVDYLADE